jgi:glutaredoxin-like YruB-family protein
LSVIALAQFLIFIRYQIDIFTYMKEVFSYEEMTELVKDAPKAYVLLFKPGSEPNECAARNIRQASGSVEGVVILSADVSKVRDIHPNYPITTVPSLLVFEKGLFRNVIKGCNENTYYRTLFEDAAFAAVSSNEKPSKSVTVYTTPSCPWCTTVKNYLRQNRIPYNEVDVSRDQRAAEDLVRKSGQQGVPQTEINGTIVVGYNKSRLDELLEIGKN